MKAHIVIDLGFGDSGKGITTARIARDINKPSVIIRQNGGHQAGHTVYYKELDKYHVHSQLSSGEAFPLVRTYLPKTFTLDPGALMKEISELESKIGSAKRNIKVYVNSDALVVTPWDIEANRIQATETQHGSVGVGFNTTINRNNSHYNLYVRDLYYPIVLKQKLESIIQNYYGLSLEGESVVLNRFIKQCDDCLWSIRRVNNIHQILDDVDTVIFESAQGTLLDQHYGFFPNVTRSDTTIKAVYDFIQEEQLQITNLNVNYVTRSYLTRHGNGPLPGDEARPVLRNDETETNVKNDWQGEFRLAPLNYELLRYAIEVNEYYLNNFKCKTVNRNLIITCMDQWEIDPSTLYNRISKPELDYILTADSPYVEDDYEPFKIVDKKVIKV